MKRILGIALLLASFSVPVFAAKNSQSFYLPTAVTVGDTKLPQGRCDVTWTEAKGSDVTLTVKTEDRKTFTLPAQLVESKQPNAGVLTSEQNGVTYLKELHTTKLRFVLAPAPAVQQ